MWLRAIRVLAELDCLFSLAKSSQALGEPVCRPEFVETNGEAWVDFEELRHPALAMRTKGDFIPNDVKLGGEVGRIALLTGEYGYLNFTLKTCCLTLYTTRTQHGVSSTRLVCSSSF